MPEIPLYARCDHCSHITEGVLEYEVYPEDRLFIEWASSLAVGVKAHHDSVPVGFGHNLHKLYKTKVEAVNHNPKNSVGFLVASRSGYTQGHLNYEEL